MSAVERYAVIGQPVAHSRSPLIHGLFAAASGAELTYEAIEISPEALSGELARLHAEGYRGLNVTLPHKTAVAALCHTRSALAERAGSVNTLIRADSGWQGDSTDGVGLVRDLRANLGATLTGARILIVGAGGAARGIIEPLLAEGPAVLALSSRNPWKPEDIAAAFARFGPIVPRTHLALKGDRYDLVINATSAGHSGGVARLPTGLFAAGALAYDLSYGPAAEPFLAWATSQHAARAVDGLGMLVEQAAESFARWRGLRPATGPVLQALRAA